VLASPHSALAPERARAAAAVPTGSLADRKHLERRLESQRRDHAQDFRRHGGVDAHIAESDTLSLRSVVDVGIVTNRLP